MTARPWERGRSASESSTEFVVTGDLVDDLAIIELIDLYGRRQTFTYRKLISLGYLPPNLTTSHIGNWITRAQNTFLDDLEGEEAGGGRGSGVGRISPVFQEPDRRLVNDAVRATLVALVGRVDDAKLAEYTDLYMSEAKRAFGAAETQEIDPMESVKAKIRGQADYKAIHTLRPEFVDEFDWVSERQGALLRAGVTPATAEQLGITQAQIGASPQDVQEAASTAAFVESGVELDELRSRMSGAMSGVLAAI